MKVCRTRVSAGECSFPASPTVHLRRGNFSRVWLRKEFANEQVISVALSRGLGGGVAGRGSVASVNEQISDSWVRKRRGCVFCCCFCLQTSVPALGRSFRWELRPPIHVSTFAPPFSTECAKRVREVVVP